MSRSKMLSFIALGLILALAVPAMAKTVKATMTLSSPAKVAGTMLDAGEYNVEAGETKVIFKKGSKTVAEAPAKWAEMENKANFSGFIISDETVKEIRFAGNKNYIVLE
jgi:hypothetical protein